MTFEEGMKELADLAEEQERGANVLYDYSPDADPTCTWTTAQRVTFKTKLHLIVFGDLEGYDPITSLF